MQVPEPIGGVLLADVDERQALPERRRSRIEIAPFVVSWRPGPIGERRKEAPKLLGVGLLLEAVREEDCALFGVGGACQRLIVALDKEYAGVPVPQKSEDNEVASTTKSLGGNFFDGSFRNPAIEATRSVDSETLLASTFANAATLFVKGADSRRSLILLQ